MCWQRALFSCQSGSGFVSPWQGMTFLLPECLRAGNGPELPVQASPASFQQQSLLFCPVSWLPQPSAGTRSSAEGSEDLIHHSPALKKGLKSKPQAHELSVVFLNSRKVVAFPHSVSGFLFPSSGYLQAFQIPKGRAGLYYGPGQCLTQEGPTLIRVPCDHRNTSTANKMHLKQKKKAVMLLFQLIPNLGRPGRGGIFSQRWAGLTWPIPSLWAVLAVLQAELSKSCAHLCKAFCAHPNVPHICLPKAGPASVNSN